MEQRRSELEFDEFEKLLGEIPNVTSENNNSMPLYVNSYKGPLNQSNGNVENREITKSKTEQSPIEGVQPDEPNLPDDSSFTSAFSELSLNCGTARPTMASPQENPHLVFVPSYHPPNDVAYNFDKLDARKVDPRVFKSLQQEGYCQNFSSGFLPVHALQGVQFVPGVEFAAMSDQPQYLSGTQSSSHYLQSLRLTHPHVSWRNIEEEQCHRLRVQQEQYFRRNPHFLYLQNEAPSKPMSPRVAHFDGLNSHRVEQSNGEPFWNENVTIRGLNKMGKPSYSEKILTRSQLGYNTAKAMKYGLGNESHHHIKPCGRFLSHNQVDNLSSWDFHSDTMNLKNNNMRLQPQKYNTLEEARGKIYFMAKDQHGCRFLQRKFSEERPKDIEMIFHEIIGHVVELMTDPFGNYLVQKLLEVCNEDQKMQILRAVTRKPGDLIRISCDMHGTRAVQKVIETLKTSEQLSMVVSALKPGIVNLIKNMNGNHVAQRCLQCLLHQCSKFLFEAAITHCVELATDRHGCCVLQKCLGHSEGEQRHLLVSEVTSNALILSQDPFGNYVLQYVFELELQWAILQILGQLEGNFTDLSMQKCSSNVVEKCLKYAGEEHRARIIRELINNTRFDQLMQDPYGNYVIQAALRQSKGALHAELVDAIRPHVPSLRNNPYGRKVLSALSLKNY